MNRIRQIFAILLICAGLVGCAVTPSPTGPIFQGIEGPRPGLAKLYVFRPSFSKLLAAEQPVLSLDGEQKVLLANDRYISFDLKPGRHSVSLIPRRFESQYWAQERELDVKPDASYFMAIWNSSEPTQGVTFAVISGLIIPLRSTYAKASGVHIELISEKDAISALEGTYEAERVPTTSR